MTKQCKSFTHSVVVGAIALLLACADDEQSYDVVVDLEFEVPPWKSVDDARDSYDDALDNYTFDIVGGEYRSDGVTLDIILESAEPYSGSMIGNISGTFNLSDASSSSCHPSLVLKSIAVFMDEGGVYVLSETDEPDEGDDRCLCMCFFDYGVSLPDISVGSLALRLVRHIPDNEPSSWSVWEGSIDLSLGSGEVLIEESVGSGCD